MAVPDLLIQVLQYWANYLKELKFDPIYFLEGSRAMLSLNLCVAILKPITAVLNRVINYGTALLMWIREQTDSERKGGPYKFADIAMQLTPVEVVRFIRGNVLLDLFRLLKLCIPVRDHGRWRSWGAKDLRTEEAKMQEEMRQTREESKLARQERRSYWQEIKKDEEKTSSLMAQIEDNGPELSAKKSAVSANRPPAPTPHTSLLHKPLALNLHFTTLVYSRRRTKRKSWTRASRHTKLHARSLSDSKRRTRG